MAAPDIAATESLGRRSSLRPIAAVALAVRRTVMITACLVITTALGAGAQQLWPGLAPGGHPHPTLHPSLAAIGSILANNARVLALPYIVVACRFDAFRATRVAANVLIAAALAVNAVTIGSQIGRWGSQLLPYLPHLPLEYLAAATAAAAWIAVRRDSSSPLDLRRTTGYAVATLLLLTAAATVEVLLTPHAR